MHLELPQKIDEVLAGEAGTGEGNLFKASLIDNCRQLNRNPNEAQIKAAWERWKQERNKSSTKDASLWRKP